MANDKTALMLANATAIARTGTSVKWSKYEVLVGERKQVGNLDIWTVDFPERGKNGVSILIADRRFEIYGGFAHFSIHTGKAFVTTEDVTSIGLDGSQPLALKISLDRDTVRLLPIPLHHVVGMDISESAGKAAKMADFSNFGIPLKITSYNLPDSPYEGLAYTLAEHRGKPPASVEREETINLAAASNMRVLFAYGQSLYLGEYDLSKGLMATIPSEVEMVLRIIRRPRMEGDTFYPSTGVVMILEDLELTKPPIASS